VKGGTQGTEERGDRLDTNRVSREEGGGRECILAHLRGASQREAPRGGPAHGSLSGGLGKEGRRGRGGGEGGTFRPGSLLRIRRGRGGRWGRGW